MNSSSKLSFCVVIPTFQRPEYLRQCLTSLVNQARKPERILVMMRDTDTPTHQAFEEFVSLNEKCGIYLERALVTEPGFLPPIKAGMEKAQGDIIAFIDDDGEALPGWLKKLEHHYADPKVGGVGGRVINMKGKEEILYPPVKTVGKFYWFGRMVGNMYRDVIPEISCEVDFFMGGNMSYRRAVLDQIQIDMKLNQEVASNYEVDLGLQIKEKGFSLIFEPKAKVRHYSAAWEGSAPRKITPKTYYAQSFNYTYVVLKHLHGWKRFAAIGYSFLIGDSVSFGFAVILFHFLRQRPISWKNQIEPSFKAKLDVIRKVKSS